MNVSDLKRRADEYARHHGLRIDYSDRLGHGQDGTIWKTNSKSAVKVFERGMNYRRERDCYQRLRAHKVTDLCGFAVPELIRFADDLFVVEISIVKAPFILDFGKAYLDSEPPFDVDQLAELKAAHQEEWGPRYPRVAKLVAALERFGIIYLDVKHGNIMFKDLS